MPFQVIYETHRIPPSPVELITAGPNQIELLCGYDDSAFPTLEADFVLTATILGDLTGHVFLWEQIGGETTGVTFITDPSLPTVIVRNTVTSPPVDPPVTGDADIKTFRFWIDKGSSVEQFDDVQICGDICEEYESTVTATASPSSPLKITFGDPRKRTRVGGPDRHDQTVDGTGFRLIPEIPPTWQSTSVAKGEIPTYQILWIVPVGDGNNTPKRITVQENQGTGWNDIFVDNDPPIEGQAFSYVGITPGYVYRLYVEFLDSPPNRLKVRQAQSTTSDLLTVPKHALPTAIYPTATSTSTASNVKNTLDATIDAVIVRKLKTVTPDTEPPLGDNFGGEGDNQWTAGRDNTQFTATIDKIEVRALKQLTPDDDAVLEDNIGGEGDNQWTAGRDNTQFTIPQYDVTERGSIWG